MLEAALGLLASRAAENLKAAIPTPKSRRLEGLSFGRHHRQRWTTNVERFLMNLLFLFGFKGTYQH